MIIMFRRRLGVKQITIANGVPNSYPKAYRLIKIQTHAISSSITRSISV